MSTIKSSAENLTLNADGANNDIIFQSNGSNVATLDQAGLLTATTFAGSGASLTALPAAQLTGSLPAISGASLTGIVNEAGTDAFCAGSQSTWVAVSDSAVLIMDNDSADGRYDTDGTYNTGTYKFTASHAGVYMFWYSVMTGQSDASNGFGFLKNSSKLRMTESSNSHFSMHEADSGDHIQTGFVVVPLGTDDTMAVCASSEGDYYGQKSCWGGCRLK